MISKGKFFGIIIFLAYIVLTYISLEDHIVDFISGTPHVHTTTHLIHNSKYDAFESTGKKSYNKRDTPYNENWSSGTAGSPVSFSAKTTSNISVRSQSINATTQAKGQPSMGYKLNSPGHSFTPGRALSSWINNSESDNYSNAATNSFPSGHYSLNATADNNLLYKNQRLHLSRTNSFTLESLLGDEANNNQELLATNTDLSSIDNMFPSLVGNMQKTSNSIDPGDDDGDMGNPIPVGDGWIFMILLAVGYSSITILKSVYTAKRQMQQ